MTLNRLKIGQSAVIEAMDIDGDLKERLFSFGVVPGEEVELRAQSIAKGTFEVLVGDAMVAIRNVDAKKIKIKLQKE